MDALLALDAGTTGVRAVAFSEGLEPLVEAYREVTQYYPAPGLVEHDPLEIARLAREVLAEVAHALEVAGHRPVALGITNQRETVVCFDAEGDRVYPRALVWQDRRGANACERLRDEGHEDLVRRVTGLVLDPYFSATKMAWLLEHGAADSMRRPTLATIDAWLIHDLTGEVATEASNASRTSLYSLEEARWSPEMLALFSLDESLLPEVRDSDASFGAVRGVAGLEGLAVRAVLGDQQAALFGQACFAPGQVKATYGTGAFVLANAGDEAGANPEGLVRTVAWRRAGITTYALEGSAFVAGAAVQWLRDEFGLVERSDELEALARSVDSSAGVAFVPAFTGLGSPFWRAEARGAILGLSRASGRGEIARAMVEALAFQVTAMLEAFSAAGVAPTELRADGGAAAMDLMLELQATSARVPVRRAHSLEATARGAAALAGLASGVFADLTALESRWRSRGEFTPSSPEVLESTYLAWRRAVERV